MTGNYDRNSDWRASYWKVESREHGHVKASNIDHERPDEDVGIYLMERSGEL